MPAELTTHPNVLAILNKDCLDVLHQMPPNSIDAVVTDPPYGLEFMGKEWDSFARTKTYKKQSAHGYSNKGILPHYGRGGTSDQREAYRRKTNVAMQEWHHTWAVKVLHVLKPGGHLLAFGSTRTHHRLMCAVEDAGFEIRDSIVWIYGSGFPKGKDTLKPAHEPIVVARKPLEGTVAENVHKWGVGALNIDRCRVPAPDGLTRGGHCVGESALPMNKDKGKMEYRERSQEHTKGRWPANVIHDGSDAVVQKFPMTRSGKQAAGGHVRNTDKQRAVYAPFRSLHRKQCAGGVLYGDAGSAARFFYCAKASRSERGPDNKHPTVKPLALMEYLIKLVTKEEQIVLDPFMGSGTTILAAVKTNRKVIGIEKEKEYHQTASQRLETLVTDAH